MNFAFFDKLWADFFAAAARVAGPAMPLILDVEEELLGQPGSTKQAAVIERLNASADTTIDVLLPGWSTGVANWMVRWAINKLVAAANKRGDFTHSGTPSPA